MFKKDRDDSTKFAVCPKCTKLYKYNDWQSTSSQEMEQHLLCKRKAWPAMPWWQQKLFCKKVEHASIQSSTIVAKASLTNREISFRKNVTSSCELWRNRHVAEDMLADVYDGNLWKEFQNADGTAFLERPLNYGFMLNWLFSTHETAEGLFLWSILLGNFKFALKWAV